VSGKKRITVDQDAWNDAMRQAGQLRQVQRDLPQMLDAVKRASEAQAERDRQASEARDKEITSKLAALSSYTRQIETNTTQRLITASAAIMSEAKRANESLKAETRQLIEQQNQRFTAALDAERDERRHDFGQLKQEIDKVLAEKAGALAVARIMVADARILHDAIDSTLPHERYAPGRLADLTSTLVAAEANIAAGYGEAAISTAQQLLVNLSRLRAEIGLRDAEWRAAHLTAVTVVTALIQQISGSEQINVVDDESGLSADLDVDYWSEGELSKVRTQAAMLRARLDDQPGPPSMADLTEISERTVVSLYESLSRAVALAQERQWASQVRVNVAAQVVEELEAVAPYDLYGEPVFAGDDPRAAFYSKLRSEDDSEIVVEVAPDETGKSCVVRVLSYDSGTPSEYQRAARASAINEAIGAAGPSSSPDIEPGEPEAIYQDFAQLRRRPPASAVQRRA
jgi:hypothetical protein